MSLRLMERPPRHDRAPPARVEAEPIENRRIVLAPPPAPRDSALAALLDAALRAFVDDAVLAVLRIRSVEHEDAAHLRLVLEPCRSGVYFDPASALARLHRARPALRAAAASACDSAEAPDLLFEVRTWIEF